MVMNCLQQVNDAPRRASWRTHRVPADAAPVWQHRIRISLTAGDNAFANDDMVEEGQDAFTKTGRTGEDGGDNRAGRRAFGE